MEHCLRPNSIMLQCRTIREVDCSRATPPVCMQILQPHLVKLPAWCAPCTPAAASQCACTWRLSERSSAPTSQQAQPRMKRSLASSVSATAGPACSAAFSADSASCLAACIQGQRGQFTDPYSRAAAPPELCTTRTPRNTPKHKPRDTGWWLHLTLTLMQVYMSAAALTSASPCSSAKLLKSPANQ